MHTEDFNIQLQESETLLYLLVDSVSHLANTLQLPRDGVIGAHSIQSYISFRALLAE